MSCSIQSLSATEEAQTTAVQELQNCELAFPPEVAYWHQGNSFLFCYSCPPQTHAEHPLAKPCHLLGREKGQDLRRAPKQELTYLLLNRRHVKSSWRSCLSEIRYLLFLLPVRHLELRKRWGQQAHRRCRLWNCTCLLCLTAVLTSFYFSSKNLPAGWRDTNEKHRHCHTDYPSLPFIFQVCSAPGWNLSEAHPKTPLQKTGTLAS